MIEKDVLYNELANMALDNLKQLKVELMYFEELLLKEAFDVESKTITFEIMQRLRGKIKDEEREYSRLKANTCSN